MIPLAGGGSLGQTSRSMTAFIWKNKIAWLAGIVVVMVFFDQCSKIWAQDALTEEREVIRPKIIALEDGTEKRVEEKTLEHVGVRTIEVIPGLFNFKYAENRAAAFSLTESIPEGLRRPLLLSVSLLACVLIAVWYLRLKVADALLMTSFALIIAGALGNFIDRARLAYVIDFLDFYVSHDGLAAWLRAPHKLPFGDGSFRLSDHWPTFNIADTCIVSGAIGVVIRTIRPLPETQGDKPGEKKADVVVDSKKG